jgi:Domain of unknown function (DUF4224)
VSFLTDAELEHLTELKQPAAQIRWLQKWRIRHTVGAHGHPRVTWDAVNGSEKPRSHPNFAALDKAG